MKPTFSSCQNLGKPSGKLPSKRAGVAQSSESLMTTPERTRQAPTPAKSAALGSAAIDFQALQKLHGIQDSARSDNTLLVSHSQRSVGSHMSTAASASTGGCMTDRVHKAVPTKRLQKNNSVDNGSPRSVVVWEETVADRVASSLSAPSEGMKQPASRELPGYLKCTQSFQTQTDTTKRMSEQRASVVVMAPAFCPSQQKVQQRSVKQQHGACRSVSPSSNRCMQSEKQLDVKQMLQNPQAEYFAPGKVSQPPGKGRRARSVPSFHDDPPARCVVESWKLNGACLLDCKWKRAFLEFASAKIVGQNVGVVSQIPASMTALRWSVAKKTDWKNLLVNDESNTFKSSCLAGTQETPWQESSDTKDNFPLGYSPGPLVGSSPCKTTNETSSAGTSTPGRSPCPTSSGTADHQSQQDHVEAQFKQLHHLAVKEEMEEMMRLFQPSTSAQVPMEQHAQQQQQQKQPTHKVSGRLQEWRQKRQEKREQQKQQLQQLEPHEQKKQQERQEQEGQPLQGVHKRRSIAELLEKRQSRDAEMEKLVEWRNSFRAAAKARLASGATGEPKTGETDSHKKGDDLLKHLDHHPDSGSEATTALAPGSPRSSEESLPSHT